MTSSTHASGSISHPVSRAFWLKLCVWASLPFGAFGFVRGDLSVSTEPVQPLSITAHTGMKPQSKLWQADGRWWGCFSDSLGTSIWELNNDQWERHAMISPETNARADVEPSQNSVTILLFSSDQSTLFRYNLFGTPARYQAIGRPVYVTLDKGVETATIETDGDGILWLASDSENQVNVRYLRPASSDFEGPITLVDGISKDDICVISSLRDGSVGVLWSNQNEQRYGFRRHVPASEPHNWFPDEVPAGTSAVDHGEGMSDDHLNIAVGTDGTLYAAVKTSYDKAGMPLVACLIRRPHGKWDPLYNVDDEGSRGIILLDEPLSTVHVIYTSYRDSAIVMKSSSTDSIAFSDRVVLMEASRINNVSSTRQPITHRFPIVAAQGDTLMHSATVIAQKPAHSKMID